MWSLLWVNSRVASTREDLVARCFAAEMGETESCCRFSSVRYIPNLMQVKYRFWLLWVSEMELVQGAVSCFFCSKVSLNKKAARVLPRSCARCRGIPRKRQFPSWKCSNGRSLTTTAPRSMHLCLWGLSTSLCNKTKSYNLKQCEDYIQMVTKFGKHDGIWWAWSVVWDSSGRSRLPDKGPWRIQFVMTHPRRWRKDIGIHVQLRSMSKYSISSCLLEGRICVDLLESLWVVYVCLQSYTMP